MVANSCTISPSANLSTNKSILQCHTVRLKMYELIFDWDGVWNTNSVRCTKWSKISSQFLIRITALWCSCLETRGLEQIEMWSYANNFVVYIGSGKEGLLWASYRLLLRIVRLFTHRTEQLNYETALHWAGPNHSVRWWTCPSHL